jgi:glycosyltransferase involved in cell wall biosynthesis
VVQLLALVDSPDHVCCRYRISAYRSHFERAGHRLHIQVMPRRAWQGFNFYRHIRSSDVVILQRRLIPAWRLSLLRRNARFLIYDFDDAVYQRDSYAPKGPYCFRRQQRFRNIVRAADVIVAGNAFLCQQARRWTSSAQVRLIPTCINHSRYHLATHASGDHVQLAWIGSSSTLQGLELARPLLEALGRRMPGLQLKLICDREIQLRHIQVVPHGWSETSEAYALASADIGISWIPDDAWSRGKCGLKILQYMAAGLPVVANPIGVQADVVRHGETGYLVQTPEEWFQAVRTLASDPALRRRMGQAGRQQIEEHYCLDRGARAWTGLLDGLTPRSKVA